MVGRSELCPCGSGKKVKRCCGAVASAGQSAPSGFPLAHQLYLQKRYRQAEQACEKALKAEPHQADGWFLLAACSLEQQAFDRAQQALERAAALAPNRPEVHFNLGHLHERRGDVTAAIAAYRQAVKLAPDYTQAWNNLGNAQRGAGQVTEAIAAFRQAVRLGPQNAPAWINLGAALKLAGDLDEARQCYARALAADARYAPAHNNLANLYTAQHDYARAEASLREALRLDPGFADAQLNLGYVLRQRGQFDAALAATRTALHLQPDNPAAWALFAQQLQGFRASGDDARTRDELTRALRHPAVDPLLLVPAAVSLLKHTPGLLPLLRDGTEEPAPARLADWFTDPLLAALLENAVIADDSIERVLQRIRASLLAAHAHGEPPLPAAALHFAARLAQQCLLTDFVYAESAREGEQVAALRAQLERELAQGAKATITPLQVALCACYRPLASLRGQEYLRVTHPAIAPVLAAHIDAPREEAAMRAGLRQLGAVSDNVSQQVQAQYEQHPYPRWVRLGMQAAQPLAQVVRAIAPDVQLPAGLDLEAPQVLVAGCGTGRHPIQTASRLAGAQVLAVDLSGASLGYAMRKARELGVGNLEFLQADILELGALTQRYDLIESFGVLHHMHDPMAGWRVLEGLLKPGGLMVIGLYSERARAAIVACREQVRERGYASDDAAIRAFRQSLLRGESGIPAPLAEAIRNSPDFYTVSDCRDLIFHVQEHRYTLPQIAAMGASLGLTCLGMDLDDPALFAAGEPGSLPPLADLAGWDGYEQAHPQAFGSTYKIWWQKPA